MEKLFTASPLGKSLLAPLLSGVTLIVSGCSLQLHTSGVTIQIVAELAATIAPSDTQPTTTSGTPVDFTLTFNRPPDASTLDPSDIIQNGTATGVVWTITQVSDTEFTITATSVGTEGTIIPSLAPGSVTDSSGNGSAGVDPADPVVVDSTVPTIGSWSMSPASGSTSNDDTPTFSGTPSEDGTLTIHALSDTTCATPLSASIAVTTGGFTNEALLAAVTGDGLKAFRYKLDNGAGEVTCSTTGLSYTLDLTSPTVTVNEASGQDDPTASTPVAFTIVFSEEINPATFDETDITQSGTATGITWDLDTSDNITWTLEATAVTGNGTLIPSVGAGAVADAVGNTNDASTSTDATVTFDDTPPAVASWSLSPADGTTSNDATPTFGGTPTQSGTLTIHALSDTTCATALSDDIAVTAATPFSGEGLSAALTGDGLKEFRYKMVNSLGVATCADTGLSYTLDLTKPTVTINQAGGQADPTADVPIEFTLVFSEEIDPASFDETDIGNSGTATGITWDLSTLDNITWTLQATAVTGIGTLIPTLAAGKVTDENGNSNEASTTTDSTVTFDDSAPTISGWSMDPADGSSSYDKTPTFGGTPDQSGTLTLYDSADTTCATPLSGSIAVTEDTAFSGEGLSSALAGSGAKAFYYKLENSLGVSTCASTGMNYTLLAPGFTVTVEQAAGQSDPVASLPVQFTVTFSEAIDPTTFTASDIVQNGTATGISWGLMTSDNTTWTLTAYASTSGGTIIPSLPVNSVENASDEVNDDSTSTDGSVTYNSPFGDEDHFELISGNGQSGSAYAALGNDFVARVVDSAGTPVPGVPVVFRVTKGRGKVDVIEDTSDVSGLVQTKLTLAAGEEVQRVTVTRKGQILPDAAASGNSILTFDASLSSMTASTFVENVQRVTLDDETSHRHSQLLDVNNDGILDLAICEVDGFDIRYGDGNGNFSGGFSNTADGGCEAMGTGDFNNDGRADLIVVPAFTATSIKVYLRAVAGGFETVETTATTSFKVYFAVGEVTGDNFDDVIGSDNGGDNLYLLTSNGDGTFTESTLPFEGDMPVLTDLDADGCLDLGVRANGSPTADIYLNDCSGGFTYSQSLTAGGTYGPFVVFGQFIGTTTSPLDALVAEGYATKLYTGTGGGAFNPTATDLTSTFMDSGLKPIDYDSDGFDDIIASGPDGREILFRTVGDGTFTNKGIAVPFKRLGSNYYYTKDVDGDGDTDVVWGDTQPFSAGSAGIHIGLNVAGTGFAPPGATLVTGKGVDASTQLKAADMDGDGDLDLIWRYGIAFLYIDLNDGAGTFTPDASFDFFDVWNFDVGDLDNDGDPDLVGCDYSSLRSRLNNGDSTLAAATTLSGPNCTMLMSEGIQVADMNWDGYLDAVIAQGTKMRTCLGRGDGSFSTCFDSDELGATDIDTFKLGDLNNDGFIDVVAANSDGSDFEVLLNSGDGNFQSKMSGAVTGANSFVLGYFRSLNMLDILFTGDDSLTDPFNTFMTGVGDGTFDNGVTVGGTPESQSVAMDLNGDGNLDLISRSYRAENLGISLGDGTGNFTLSVNLGASYFGDYGTAPLVADLDGDGKLDIAVRNQGGSGGGHLIYFGQ